MTLTAKEITNLYLYGPNGKPSNLVSDTLIREPLSGPNDFGAATLTQNMQDFMSTGPGRFVKGQHFNLVDEFFTTSLTDFTEHSGFQYGISYSKTEIAGFLEMSTAKTQNVDYDEAAVYQTNYSDGSDYAERVYIYNSGTYLIDNNATFTILANGERRVDNFAIRVFNDNFDFDGGKLAIIGNILLEDAIDPSKIGRKVEIPFQGAVSETLYDYNGNGYYDDSDYAHEQTLINGYGGLDLGKLNSDIADLALNLWVGVDHVTKFLDAENRPIVYGTDGANDLSPDDINGSNWADINGVPTIADSDYENNGVALIGGKGNDTLTGGANHDVLLGGDDHDSLDGGDGWDTLLGGMGGDTLQGGDKPDLISDSLWNGAAGFWSDAANDMSSDSLYGGAGNDWLTSYGGSDALYGEGDNDWMWAMADSASSTLYGGDGSDGLNSVSNNAVTLNGGAGVDYYAVFSGSAFINDSEGDSIITVNPGAYAEISTNGGGQLFIGDLPVTDFRFDPYQGPWLVVGSGWYAKWSSDYTFDIFLEGSGTAIRIWNFEEGDFGIEWSQGTPAPWESGGPSDLSPGDPYPTPYFNELPDGSFSLDENGNSGTSGDDNLVGDSGNNVLDGGAGNDSLTGGAGDDSVSGGDGSDTIVGGTGAGNDTYDGGTGNDWVYYPSTSLGISVNLLTGIATGSEIDTDQLSTIENIRGGGGNDTLIGDSEANKIEGKAGNDSLSGGAGNDSLWGDEGNDYANGGAGNDSVYGWTGDDTLVGDSGNDFLGGDGGQDFLNGGDGNDSIYGWDGNDNLLGGWGNDTLSGEAGNDTLDGGSEKDALTGGAGADVFRFSNLGHSVGTGSLYDRITDFQKGVDRIDLTSLGFTSLDTDGGSTETGELRLSFSSASNRTYVKSDQSDFIFYLDGDYSQGANLLTDSDFLFSSGGGTLAGTSGADSLPGSGLNDSLYGLAGNDTLVGGNGNDTLDGGADKDVLTGGAGADFFKFSAPLDSNDSSSSTFMDRITDFVKGTDKLDLSALGFIGLDTDGGSTETGELRLAYSATSNRTYVRSDQSTFEFYLDGDYSQGANQLTNADFVF